MLLISSYGCTWEFWRALKKLEFLSPGAALTLLSALQTSRVHPSLDTAVSTKVVPKSVKAYATMSIGIMGSEHSVGFA